MHLPKASSPLSLLVIIGWFFQIFTFRHIWTILIRSDGENDLSGNLYVSQEYVKDVH